ncbi:keratin, type I cytoskeletal 18-like isoform X2 [Salarias fasciatus]|uniref:keratin, type I cytoskeletal 18-like isoform X2 n=1 Tax=Salarias fasciatus TaxID=181472 RepID=UPI001176DE4B|nr:keratin, type I cytoskeletal 18-like isoform X2 [Salarias fasciatus]
MPSQKKAASVFGGAGGRGSRASVASLEGLRNVLRNETERDSAPVSKAAAAPEGYAAPGAPAAAPQAPVAPADDKQTLRGLNDRLSGFLDRVKQLQDENRDLQREIDDILAKRKTPEGRDWEETQKPLEELKKQIKDITMDNARLLLLSDNTKMANEDFKDKLDNETRARKELEKDLEDLKRVIDDTRLNCEHKQKEIDLVKDEIARLDQEHKEEVDVLREKIKDSEVTVEIESSNSDLAEALNKVRAQYDRLAEKNLKETDDWYKSKFEYIKVEEAQNVEALQSGKTELKDLQREKQTLEIQIQTLLSMIRNLEETLRCTKVEYGQRMAPLHQAVVELERELREVRAQVEQQAETNKNLLCVKMKLEAEINNYQQLMCGMTSDSERPAKARGECSQ